MKKIVAFFDRLFMREELKIKIEELTKDNTSLKNNLIQAAQNVEDMQKKHKQELENKETRIALLEGRISTLQNISTES